MRDRAIAKAVAFGEFWTRAAIRSTRARPWSSCLDASSRVSVAILHTEGDVSSIAFITTGMRRGEPALDRPVTAASRTSMLGAIIIRPLNSMNLSSATAIQAIVNGIRAVLWVLFFWRKSLLGV